MSTRRIPVKKLLSLLLLLLFLAGMLLLFFHLGIFSVTEEDLRERLEGTGAAAPLLFILVTFLQVTLIPIPSTVTVLGGSYLFGAWPSLLYSYVGLLLGSVVAFWLGRVLGKRFVYWMAGDRERVDMLLERAHDRECVALFFMFLLPAFPDDLICLVAGILPISFRAFLVMQLFTRLTSVGATLFFFSGELIPFSGWGIPVIIGALAAALVLFVLCFRYADRLAALFERTASRIGGYFLRKSKEDTTNEDP